MLHMFLVLSTRDLSLHFNLAITYIFSTAQDFLPLKVSKMPIAQTTLVNKFCGSQNRLLMVKVFFIINNQSKMARRIVEACFVTLRNSAIPVRRHYDSCNDLP